MRRSLPLQRALPLAAAAIFILWAAGARVAQAQAPPRITSVAPKPVVGSTSAQWLTLNGRGFARGFTVRLRTTGVDAVIDDRSRLGFEHAGQVRVKATLGTEAATWRVQVIGPDSVHSNTYAFQVVAPVPQIEVMGPVQTTEGEPGFTLTVYSSTVTSSSLIYWKGETLPTTPLRSSKTPHALTIGLRARIPDVPAPEEGGHTVRVWTPPPGGGLSPPKTLFTTPRPFYQKFWLYMAFVAGLIVLGLALHWWHLRNVREHELKRKVEEYAQDLRAEKEKVEWQAERLADLDEAKNRSVANLSHELRTPLTLIRGALGHLAEDAVPPAQTGDAPSLGLLQRNVRHLEHLVDQLLDLTRLGVGQMQGPLQLQRSDLVAFARETVRAFEGGAERKGVALQCRASPSHLPVPFDADKLRTVLNNLLSNALQVVPEEGTVTVTVADTSGAHAVLRVEDTGPGLPEEELPHLFEPFHQAESTPDRAQGGMGIGLALSKELVELHGGQLRAQSEEGAGTAFIVTLPKEPEDALPDGAPERENGQDREGAPPRGPVPPLQAPSSRSDPPDLEASDPEAPGVEPPAFDEAQPSEAPVVLVVEDNRDMHFLLRSTLGGDYQIMEAENGIEALAALRSDDEQRPDLVLSDIMMPEMDGEELCRRIKEDDALDDLPVILITARAGEAERIRGLETYADDYLEKPFPLDELRIRIRNLIENRRTLREHFRQEARMRPADEAGREEENAFYERARAAVEEHLDDPDYTVKRLAQDLHQSESTLRRRLKAATDLTAATFIRQVRLERAAQMLAREETATVSQTAYAVGYRGTDHFAQLFRERFGVPPSRYPPAGASE